MRFEPSTFGTVLVGAVVGTATIPVAAVAAPRISALETVVAPVGPGQVRSLAVGDGTVVWTESGPAAGAPLALRTRDANGPRTVAQVDGPPDAVPELEVGRTADGSPVVAVTVQTGERSTIDLVRLTDGRRTRLPSRLRRGDLRGVGIDRGWIYATRTTGTFPKRKASLWRARISGLEVGGYRRIRNASRTEDWSRVAADRNRVAVLAARGIKRGGAFLEETWLAGTPRGPVVRVGQTYATNGGYEPTLVAGFTGDGGAMITVRNDTYAPSPAKIQRVPLRGGGKARTVQLDAPMQTEADAVAFDGGVDRLVVVGPDLATGALALGTVAVPWGPAGR